MSEGFEQPGVHVEVTGAVATVTVDAPPVNALGEQVLRGLEAAFTRLAGQEEVRCVILTGAGERVFVAGADLGELEAMTASREAVRHHTGLTAQVLRSVSTSPQPVVAAVRGAATGGGLELMLACDLAVAEEGVKLGFPEIRLGLIPGAGGTQRLARRIGAARAQEMILRSTMIDAGEARSLGLVSSVASRGSGLREAQRMASELAELPARAVRAAKAVIRDGLDGPLEDGLAMEREAFEGLLGTEDAREGVAAFLAKRDPSFTHR